MTLTGYRACLDGRDADGTVRSLLEAPKTRSAPTPGMHRVARYPGAPGPAARRAGDPVRRSARGGAAHRAGGRNTVEARECATAQGSEVEDRGRAPVELAARFGAATRTQPREPSRSAGTIRSHSSAEMSAVPACISMHRLAYSRTVRSAPPDFLAITVQLFRPF